MDGYEIERSWHDLLFRVTTSVFYHSRRARFLQSFKHFAGVCALFLNGSSGLALFASLLTPTMVSTGIGKIFPLVVASLNFLFRVLTVEYRIDDTIRADDSAANVLRKLQTEIELAGPHCTRKRLAELWKCAEEVPPPQYTLRILYHISYNEAVDAMESVDKKARVDLGKLWFWQRWFAPIVDLPPKPNFTAEEQAESHAPVGV